MQHYADMKVLSEWGCNRTNWSAISENQLWGSGTIMTGNTSTTIQIGDSAGICTAVSFLQISLLSHWCKLDPGSVPPSCHQLPYRTQPPFPSPASNPRTSGGNAPNLPSPLCTAYRASPPSLCHSIYQSQSLEPQFLPSALPRPSSASSVNIHASGLTISRQPSTQHL